MAGYAGYSRSNNAIAAENEGRYPMTKGKKIVANSLGVTQAEARRRLEEQGPCEYHHTSKYYKATNYYDVAVLIADARGIDLDDAIELINPGYQDRAAQEAARLKEYRRKCEKTAQREKQERRTEVLSCVHDWTLTKSGKNRRCTKCDICESEYIAMEKAHGTTTGTREE
jgi:hypothetical protein